MATLPVTVLDSFLPEVVAAMRAYLGEEAIGKTDRQLLPLYLRVSLGQQIKAQRRRVQVAAALATEVAARVATEQALATENAARLIVEAQVDAQVVTDMGGIS